MVSINALSIHVIFSTCVHLAFIPQRYIILMVIPRVQSHIEVCSIQSGVIPFNIYPIWYL